MAVLAEGGDGVLERADPGPNVLVGFVDLVGGNYRLSAGSAYLGKGYDGRDIGADINQVEALTRNAVVAP